MLYNELWLVWGDDTLYEIVYDARKHVLKKMFVSENNRDLRQALCCKIV